MKFLEEQRLGEPVLQKSVTAKSVIWTARWVHRIKGDRLRCDATIGDHKAIDNLGSSERI
eukprot:5321508-Amphidinium_carterae.1